MNRDTPTFNLKAVVQETGIKPDTLRAWERRYGLPEPDRSPGGHRLYSQRDIDILHWLLARQDEGLTISRAVDLWRTLKEQGQDPLRTPEYAVTNVESLAPHVQGEQVQSMRAAWIEACLTFDEREAERILSQAFALYPPEVVCVDVLQKGLRQIGQDWYAGQASVQQEHFASALAMRRLEAMISAAPLPTRSGRILLACPPQEEHVFSLTLLHFLLRRRGWETLYLGANVPLDRLESSIEAMHPNLVILTAQQLHTAATLAEMAKLLQHKRTPVGYGGYVFTEIPDLRQHIPAHFLGEEIEQALETVEELIPIPPPIPTVDLLSQSYRTALAQFQDQLPAINAQVTAEMRQYQMYGSHLSTANLNLARGIMAALKLGDISLLQTDIDWVQGLLENHQIPVEKLQRYMQVYYDVTKAHLNDEASPVLEWLNELNEEMAAGTGSDS